MFIPLKISTYTLMLKLYKLQNILFYNLYLFTFNFKC